MSTVTSASKALLLPMLLLVQPVEAASTEEQCLLEQLRGAAATTTVEQLRQRCQPVVAGMEAASSLPAAQVSPAVLASAPEAPAQTSVEKRLSSEMQAYDNPFVMTTHRPNYFIFAHQFNNPNEAPYAAAFPGDDIAFRNWEAKFQLSLKFPLALNIFGDNGDLMAGYTNRSFWQVFNHHLSAPFRETNHEPELWFRWRSGLREGSWAARVFNLGFNHQSNGQAGSLSRSWNRLFAAAVVERNNLALGLRLSKRIPEKSGSDDNPDIERYIGGVELTAVHHASNHVSSLMLRTAPDTGRSALQLDYSYPLYKNLRGYIQWYDGYGESMIDYNYRSRSLGFGIQLGGWL